MSDMYEQLDKPELISRLRALEQSFGPAEQLLQAELSVHREELNSQHEELVATHATLEATLAEYEDLYNHAPLPYLAMTDYGVVVSLNKTAVERLAISKVEMLDRPFVLFVDEPDVPKFLDHMRRCRGTAEEVVSEVSLKTSGRTLPVLMSSRPALDENGATVYRTALTDLTALKQAEAEVHQLNATLEERVRDRTQQLEQATGALREVNRRKDDFLAMLAHELRNPLAPIRNAVDLWKLLGEQRPELEELRQVIERQVSHMARLIDDLLDVARIIRDKIKLRRTTTDLTPIVRQVVDDFRHQLESAELSLQVEVPEEPIWVLGDETRLAQILSNLVHNAVKFTDPGGTVIIRATSNDLCGKATLTVGDTGIGMDPVMIERVFETFSQADRTLDRSRGGLGLGLALVKGLVELHGGIVRATSGGYGQGTEVTIDLPLTQADSIQPPPQPEPAVHRALRVVVIDDRHDAVLTMRRLLVRLNHEVATALDGETGLQRARELRPDVILSDIGLPGMDGYDVAREIRRDPDLHSTCLVAITGYGQADDQKRAFDAGFNHHLTKPIALDDLRKLLAQVEPERKGGFPPISSREQ